MDSLPTTEESKISFLRWAYNFLTEFFLYIPRKTNLPDIEESKTQNGNIHTNRNPSSLNTDRDLSSQFRNCENSNKIDYTDLWKSIEKKGIEINIVEEDTMESFFANCGIELLKSNIQELLKGLKSTKKNNKIKIGLITFLFIMNILLIICLLQILVTTPFDYSLSFLIPVLALWTIVIFLHVFEIVLLIKKTFIKNCTLKILFLIGYFVNEGITIAYLILIRDISPHIYSYSIILLVGYNMIWIIYLFIICIMIVITILIQIFLTIFYVIVFLPYSKCCSTKKKDETTICKPKKSSDSCPICYNKLDKIGEKIAQVNCISNHQFHAKCIGLWLLMAENCPLDRTKVNKITV